MPTLSRVCGVDCKPNSSNCNGYCEGRAESPETYEIKIEHLLNGAAVRHQNIDMLLLSASNEIEQLRTENAALTERVKELEAKNALQNILLDDYGVTHDQQQRGQEDA